MLSSINVTYIDVNRDAFVLFNDDSITIVTANGNTIDIWVSPRKT